MEKEHWLLGSRFGPGFRDGYYVWYKLDDHGFVDGKWAIKKEAFWRGNWSHA